MLYTDLKELPKYFDRYIKLVPEDMHLMDALHKYGPEYYRADLDILNEIGDRVYAADKWSIKDILQHLIDAERVFTYRAMCFSRAEKIQLPSFDEDGYALEARASHRLLEDLFEEMHLLRQSTIALFSSFDTHHLQSIGQTISASISVPAIGFTLAGHFIHHKNVLVERYYPIINKI